MCVQLKNSGGIFIPTVTQNITLLKLDTFSLIGGNVKLRPFAVIISDTVFFCHGKKFHLHRILIQIQYADLIFINT